MSYRNRDSNVEKEISKFLDYYFYLKTFKDFIRYQDKTNQLLGKDVSVNR